MNKFIKFLAITFLIVGGLSLIPRLLNNREKAIVGIPEPSLQKTRGIEDVEVGGRKFQIEKKYRIETSGLVAVTKKYTGGGFLDTIAPADIVLEWGEAAQYNDLITYEWILNDRGVKANIFYSDEAKQILGDFNIYDRLTFNTLIPCDDFVSEQIKKINKDDYIRLNGYLVDVILPEELKEPAGRWKTGFQLEDLETWFIYVTDVEWLEE